MLKANQKLALFCEATMGQPNTKMAEGILRYGPNECVAVIDSKAAGKSLKDFWKLDTNLPIVGTLNEAIALGAEVLVLGTAPSGGRLPDNRFGHRRVSSVRIAVDNHQGCPQRIPRLSPGIHRVSTGVPQGFEGRLIRWL